MSKAADDDDEKGGGESKGGEGKDDDRPMYDDDAKSSGRGGGADAETLCSKVSKFFYEDDDFAQVFETWVEERAGRVDPDTCGQSTECVSPSRAVACHISSRPCQRQRRRRCQVLVAKR